MTVSLSHAFVTMLSDMCTNCSLSVVTLQSEPNVRERERERRGRVQERVRGRSRERETERCPPFIGSVTGERVSVMDRYKTEEKCEEECEDRQTAVLGECGSCQRWVGMGQNSVMVGSATPPPVTMATEWQHGNTRDHAVVCVLDQSGT